MIEVPEYLLERSRQRRAELTGKPSAGAGNDAAHSGAKSGASAAGSSGGGVADIGMAGGAGASAAGGAASSVGADGFAQAAIGGSAARGGNTGVGYSSASALFAKAESQKPDPPYVKAAKSRKKMPAWATAMVMCLPIWAVFYVGMLEPPSTDELVLAVNGAEVYGTCASCHGVDGSGLVTGRQLNNGEVLLTFPANNQGLAQQISWVYLGTSGTQDLGFETYGDTNRPGGARQLGSYANGMSGFSNLSLADLASVVYYERVTHGGLNPERAALEEEMLLAFIADNPSLGSGSPDDVQELIQSSYEAHGGEVSDDGGEAMNNDVGGEGSDEDSGGEDSGGDGVGDVGGDMNNDGDEGDNDYGST